MMMVSSLRSFLLLSCVAGALGCVSSRHTNEPASSTLIVNAHIVDGSGEAARDGAIRIEGDRIASLGALRPLPGETVIDAKGYVAAPGFIDCHSHLDRTIFDKPEAAAAITQGVTTLTFGADGFSQYPLADFLARIGETKVAVNVAAFSGHNTLRALAMPAGDLHRPANREEIAAMKDMLAADIAAGAAGLASGLGYEPGVFSDTNEVVQLSAVAAEHGLLYASHIRNEGPEVKDAIAETVEIAQESGAAAHVSHIKIGIKKFWGDAQEILATLDAARANGLDMSADIYPYAYWQTTMRILFPNKQYDDPSGPAMNFRETTPPEKLIFQRYLPDPSIEGRTLADIAAEREEDVVDLYLGLMAAALDYEAAHPDMAGKTESIIGESMSEEDTETFMAWPQTSICSDGFDGGHPRGYGAFTRVLGVYVRERSVLSLEEAVRKMSALNAEQMSIPDRGVLKAGAYADIVLFDPETVADRASIENPTAPSAGIELVMVNGEIVYQDERFTGVRPGRSVKAQTQ